MCMYVYMYICVCVYMYMYICIYVYIYMYIHIETMWWPCLYTYRSAPRRHSVVAYQPLLMVRSRRLHRSVDDGAWGIARWLGHWCRRHRSIWHLLELELGLVVRLVKIVHMHSMLAILHYILGHLSFCIMFIFDLLALQHNKCAYTCAASPCCEWSAQARMQTVCQ